MANILVGIGSALMSLVRVLGLRLVLACVLLASGVALLGKSGVDIPMGASVGAPVALGVLSAVLYRCDMVLVAGRRAQTAVAAPRLSEIEYERR